MRIQHDRPRSLCAERTAARARKIRGRRRKTPQEAGKLAGYHPKSVYRILRLPAVAAAISETIQLDLVSIGAPMAYRVAKTLFQDVSVSARVTSRLVTRCTDATRALASSRREK